MIKTIAVAVDAIKEFGCLSTCLAGAPLPGSPPFISKQKDLGGYDTTYDALCSGHPTWHAPADLERDSGSMSLGAPLFQGSHCGSYHDQDNGSSGGCNQRIWMSQQLFGAPLPGSSPFVSKQKELGDCIDGGHHSAAGPYSSGDHDSTGSATALVHPANTKKVTTA
jgi:hypothetical protein